MSYMWKPVEGKAVMRSAWAYSPVGRLQVDQRRGTLKFLARVDREVIGDEYTSMEVAKKAAELEAAQRVDRARLYQQSIQTDVEAASRRAAGD